jgi:hypothetical protein
MPFDIDEFFSSAIGAAFTSSPDFARSVTSGTFAFRLDLKGFLALVLRDGQPYLKAQSMQAAKEQLKKCTLQVKLRSDTKEETLAFRLVCTNPVNEVVDTGNQAAEVVDDAAQDLWKTIANGDGNEALKELALLEENLRTRLDQIQLIREATLRRLADPPVPGDKKKEGDVNS